MYDLCIIGFGISGICSARNASKKNLNFIVLESNKSFGGCWYDKAFNWTKLQTHKKFYQFPDLPMNPSVSDYPTREDLLSYFNNYIIKFNLDKHVRYNHFVIKTKYNKNYWNIIYKSNNSYNFIQSKYLLVCSGLFNQKTIPNIISIDKFKGNIYHSKDLDSSFNNIDIINNKILIIGNGASCSDILFKLKDNKNKILVLYKTPKWYVKRYIFGISISFIICNFVLQFSKLLPEKIFIFMFYILLKIGFSNNLPTPNKKVSYKNLVADDNIIDLNKKDKIEMIKGKIIDIQDKKVKIQGKDIIYKKHIDVIIFATGYSNDLNFLNLKHLPQCNNNIVNVNIKNCGFIGFNPSYNWIEVSYYQSLWFINKIKHEHSNYTSNDNSDNSDNSDIINVSNEINVKDKNLNKVFPNDLTYDSFNYISYLKRSI